MKLQAVIPITLLLAAVSMAQLVFSSQRKEIVEKDKPTLIQKGVMSEEQRKHSKLYNEYSTGQSRITDLLALGKPALVRVFPPTPALNQAGTPFRSFLKRLSCNADAVVIGKVESKSSQLTEKEDFIFTDYEMRVVQILKDNTSAPILSESTITITRPGGAIELDRRRGEAIDESFQPFKVGKHYLLFLRAVTDTGAYRAIDSTASFTLGETKVTKLTKEVLQLTGEVDDPIGFVTEVRSSIADCGAK